MMSPLTDRDISELDEWVRARYIATARASLEGVTGPDREETLRIAMDRAMALTWLSGEGLKLIATIDGTARLLWQSIYRSHPDLKYEDLRQLMLDPRNIANVNEAFKELNVGPGKSFQKRGPKPPVRKKRKR